MTLGIKPEKANEPPPPKCYYESAELKEAIDRIMEAIAKGEQVTPLEREVLEVHTNRCLRCMLRYSDLVERSA